MKLRWLDRRISAPGPFLALCLTEEHFLQACKHMRVKSPPDFMSSTHANATMHTFSGERGVTCVVCMGDCANRDPVEIVGLLTHEAVHVWQEYCAAIGEKQPAVEQEAYAVQSITQSLVDEYDRQRPLFRREKYES